MKFTYWLPALALLFWSQTSAQALDLIETPFLEPRVSAGGLPPVERRLPVSPLVSDMQERNRELGRHGGDLRTIAGNVRDLRLVTVYGYARLLGYNENLVLEPDLLQSLEVEDERIFTFTLREGHRWSDGAPFTAEDFRYWWEDIANNPRLSPAGPPEIMLAGGEPPRFEVLDARRVRYSWKHRHPRLLPHLAEPRPVFIYAPAHYLRQFHERYANPEALAVMVREARASSWAALHNRRDEPYANDNPDMPTLSPWRNLDRPPGQRFVFERNPFFHRVDPAGRQLPYIDRIIVEIVSPGLFAAKANAGEVDILARGLSMSDIAVLKEGEARGGYRTLLWRQARGSAYALYPNLTVKDPVFRALNRDVRFRRALSLAIDRRILNNALLYGVGRPSNNTVLEESPLFRPEFQTLWAQHDPKLANKLLDEAGLSRRDGSGTRLLPDGRPLLIVVEVDGRAGDFIDALQLIEEFWREVGVRLFIKPQERSVLRDRAFAGNTVMSASTGLENGIPTAIIPPDPLAPVRQELLTWPAWGQFYETRGAKGEAPDIAEARNLMDLRNRWLAVSEPGEKTRIWTDMLRIHAEQQFVIGTVAGDLQPIVVNRRLRNVPEEGLFSWDPTALMGVYRMDEFFLVP